MNIIQGPGIRTVGSYRAAGVAGHSFKTDTAGIYLREGNYGLHWLLILGDEVWEGGRAAIITAFHPSNFIFTGKHAAYKNGHIENITEIQETPAIPVRAVKL